MSEFKSYSQAGQDIFCNAVLNKDGGTFLDVGACHPTEWSNTYALETQRQWRGLLVDNDPGAIELLRRSRKNPAILEDATKMSWPHIFKQFSLSESIDYLSLDVDSSTISALANLLSTFVKFKVITVEHDRYRFGEGPRSGMRSLLVSAGYDLVCGDVHDQGLAFEDWFCDPSVVTKAARFRCAGKDWKDIMV